jgi:uncharacterized coiled-coil DUF342 family protein
MVNDEEKTIEQLIVEELEEYRAVMREIDNLSRQETDLRNKRNDLSNKLRSMREKLGDRFRDIDKDLAQAIGLKSGLVYKDAPNV